MATEKKKKMQVVEFPSPNVDKCPRKDRHKEYKAEARKDKENGRSGCPSCKTTWAVREIEELEDWEVENQEALDQAREESNDSVANIDGNAGVQTADHFVTDDPDPDNPVYDGDTSINLTKDEKPGITTTKTAGVA